MGGLLVDQFKDPTVPKWNDYYSKTLYKTGAVLSAVIASLYFVLYHFCLKHRWHKQNAHVPKPAAQGKTSFKCLPLSKNIVDFLWVNRYFCNTSTKCHCWDRNVAILVYLSTAIFQVQQWLFALLIYTRLFLPPSLEGVSRQDCHVARDIVTMEGIRWAVN